MSDLEIKITTELMEMDVAMIQEFLSGTYWANGRTVAEVRTTLDNSTPFGLFVAGEQAAFARVLTDRVAFAYLMDVFVVPAYRGRGLAYRLIDYVLSYPDFARVRTWGLKTVDAQDLYRKFGFETVSETNRMMSLTRT